MQNHLSGFRRYQGRSKFLSFIFLVLGIAGAVFVLIGLIFYFRRTPAENILIEIPILLVLLAAFLINISLLNYTGGNSSVETRRQNILITILAWTAIIYFFNGVLPAINWKRLAWQPVQILPPGKTAGIDFEAGLYDPAKDIVEGTGNYYVGYAPVVTLLAIPFTFFSFPKAYVIFMALLYATNIAAILGANFLAGDISEKNHSRSWELASMITMYTLTSYGMFFSLERGNFDVFIVFFAVIGMYFLVRFPEKIWLPTLFLSLATHMKLYPGILLAILLWKYGRRSLLPLFAINIGLFFVLGIKPFMEFFARLGPYSADPFITVKNSSAVSFAEHLINIQGVSLGEDFLTWVLAAIPLLVWLGSALYLYKKGFSSLGMLWYFVISFAPMFALPSVSHDYKLVILSVPLLLVLFRLAQTYTQTGSASVAILIILFMITALFIHRSVFDSKILFLQNKYCSILAFQLLSVWGMYTDFSYQKSDIQLN